MRFWTRLLLIGVSSVLSIGGEPDRRAVAQAPQTLTAFYTAPVAIMAPLWIAKETDLFKKHGVDVNVSFIASGPAGTATLLSGGADVGIMGGFAPVQAILGGAKDLMIIGESTRYIVGSIVGRKEIQGVQDLRGKRLGIDRIGSNPDMYTLAALARFNIDPRRDLNYIQLGDIGQGVTALKAGTIDALTVGPPQDLFAQRLGYKVILDITDLKIPFWVTVLVSARDTIERKQSEIKKFMRAYAEATQYFLKNREGTTAIIAKYTKIQDAEALTHSIEAVSPAMERTLQVDPKGIDVVLGQIRNTIPQAASAKAEEFYDPRFFTDLRESGFLKSLWGEN